jgi:two-component system sensor histidine kinase BaeS
VVGAPLIADARPVLRLPTTFEPGDSTGGMTSAGSGMKITATAISTYHYQRKLKRCLMDAGITLTATVGPYGIEAFEPAVLEAEPPRPISGQLNTLSRCKKEADTPAEDFAVFADATETCAALRDPAMRDCLQSVFLRQISQVTPEPLRVYIGASDDRPAGPPVGPVAMAAGVVAVIAVAGIFLLSRRVLLPIRALTVAADRLGQGRLTDRVPVKGRDELAALSRAFNRMAQALQDSEERQRRMSADIAHELRTPLTNLRGYLEALTDGTAEPSRELFWSLREEALLQQRIIDDLQDLALAEAGRLSYRRVPVDLAEMVEGYARQHFSGEIDILVRADGPAYVVGDPDRLRQAVNNLVRNALAACGPGGRVGLTVVHSGPYVELSVSDTGGGIAAEDLPHVFERFWRADRARPRGSGVGLGLAIVRQIVDDHAGTIGVNSRLGHGATFTLRLPARQRAGGPA